MAQAESAFVLSRYVRVHHRLASITGHRYTEAKGILAAAERQGIRSILLITLMPDSISR